MPRTISRGLLLVLALLATSIPARAREAPSLALGVGLFDLAAWSDEGDFDAVEAGIQLRGATSWIWGTGPVLGVSATEDGSFWGYAGLRRPFATGDRWRLVPSVAVGYYEEGDGKDLGHEIEFRSGLEVAFRFDGGSTLGLEFYHLSNASLSEENPGTNNLVLVWSVPLGD